MIRDLLGREVGSTNFLHNPVEEVGITELADKLAELEVLEDLPGTILDPLDI